MTRESETSHPLDEEDTVPTLLGDEQCSSARGDCTSPAPSLGHIPRSVQVQRKAMKMQGFSQAPSWGKGKLWGNNPQLWSSNKT